VYNNCEVISDGTVHIHEEEEDLPLPPPPPSPPVAPYPESQYNDEAKYNSESKHSPEPSCDRSQEEHGKLANGQSPCNTDYRSACEYKNLKEYSDDTSVKQLASASATEAYESLAQRGVGKDCHEYQRLIRRSKPHPHPQPPPEGDPSSTHALLPNGSLPLGDEEVDDGDEESSFVTMTTTMTNNGHVDYDTASATC
jgi:hypothetical protein